MILEPGRYRLRRKQDEGIPVWVDYASVSAQSGSRVTVWVNDERIEDIYVGPYSPHTWWAGNALFGVHQLSLTDTVTIHITGEALMRLESNMELLLD
jgi:hypothetical protein